MMWGHHWMYGGFVWIFWLAVIIGVFFLIRWLVRSGGPGAQPPKESAMEILKKRYASGEISKEEFEQKKKDLLS